MKATKNKILVEVLEEEKKSSVITSDTRKPYVKAKVLSVGEEVIDIKAGDEIVVFNVHESQILDYEGRKLMFIRNDNEGGFFMKL